MSVSGAYIVKKRKKRGPGALFAVLILLSAAIVLAVIFVPRFLSEPKRFGGRTYYFVATEGHDEYAAAYLSARDISIHGGAGYIYNDGRFRVVMAVYASEAEAAAVASVNAGTECIAVAIPARDDGADVLCFFADEWLPGIMAAAVALDRGTLTSAAAGLEAEELCERLLCFADALGEGRLRRATVAAGEYALSSEVGMLSYLRYIAARGVALMASA